MQFPTQNNEMKTQLMYVVGLIHTILEQKSVKHRLHGQRPAGQHQLQSSQLRLGHQATCPDLKQGKWTRQALF
jgi:hypothetical protein